MNFTTVNYFNLFLGAGAILLQGISIVALLTLFFGPKRNAYLSFISKNFLWLAFAVSLSAALFSLIYSEVIGYLPCYLCWYQRVFLFPLPFIFGVAIYCKDRRVVKYASPLLVLGFLISVYQNFVYYFNPNAAELPCDASGVSCYKQLVSVFGGYISIPMLALTSFFALGSIILVAHFYRTDSFASPAS